MPNGKGRLFGRFENRDFGISEMDHFSRKAVARRCSAKMMLLEIPQNLQESTYARVSLVSESQSYYWLKFFVTKHISNHTIKHYQYFAFFIWFVLINIFINIFHIFPLFNKTFMIITMP